MQIVEVLDKLTAVRDDLNLMVVKSKSGGLSHPEIRERIDSHSITIGHCVDALKYFDFEKKS